MEIIPSNIQSMFTAYSLLWAQGYTNAEVWAPKVATILPPMNAESITNGWMDKIPKFREWLGPRVVHNVSLRGRVMTAKTYELTMAIDKERVEDDSYGLFASSATDLGTQAAKKPDELLAAKLQENPTCFDGLSFFNDAHPEDIDAGVGAGSYDNNLALALTPANFGIARATMRAYKGADHQTLGVRPSLLVVPPSLEDMAMRIMTNDYLPTFLPGSTTAGNVAAEPNIYKGACDVLVIDELENEPTRWYLLDNRKAIKPLVYWNRRPPSFTYLNKPDDANVFFNRQFVFGGDLRGVADVSLPFLALRSTP